MDAQLESAIEMAKAGHRAEARNLLAMYLNRDPSDAAAWKWFATVAESQEEARTALYNVLALSPNDAWARQGLATLQAQQRRPAPTHPQTSPRRPQQRPRAASGLAIVLALTVAGLCLVGVALATFRPRVGISSLPLAADVVETTPIPLPEAGDGTAPQILPATWTPSPTPTQLPSVTPLPTVTLTPIVPTPAALDLPPVSDFDHSESDSPLDTTEPIVETQSVSFYPVTGANAFEINESILQNGPKGNGQDAIAQIQYGISLRYTLLQSPVSCAPDDAVAFLDMVFTYPEYSPPPDAPQSILDQWDSFLQRVISHEETHAQIARECALETVTDFYALSPTGTCAELQASIESTQNANDQACDAEQLAFDDLEGDDSFP